MTNIKSVQGLEDSTNGSMSAELQEENIMNENKAYSIKQKNIPHANPIQSWKVSVSTTRAKSVTSVMPTLKLMTTGSVVIRSAHRGC